jgi:hypothetical protein
MSPRTFKIFSVVIVPLLFANLPNANPQNYSGSIPDLEVSLSLVAIFVMGTPVVLAFTKLFQDKNP